MGVGPVCQTSLSIGLSEWELGPRHAEQSLILFHNNLNFMQLLLALCTEGEDISSLILFPNFTP